MVYVVLVLVAEREVLVDHRLEVVRHDVERLVLLQRRRVPAPTEALIALNRDRP